MAELDPYRRKRDPRRTPEPFGGSKGGDSKEAARRSSSSSATTRVASTTTSGSSETARSPRGRCRRGSRSNPVERYWPSTSRTIRSITRTFAGEIPKGQYGAGTVEIWDTGTYELLEEKRNGQLTVRLAGKRLNGVWTLVPAHLDGKEQNWLLIRGSDGEGDANRAGADATYRPMLATPSDELPAGEGWLYEVKWDGYRALAYVRGGECRLVSRNGNDLTERFASVAKAVAKAVRTPNAVLDGEVCALDEHGRPSFSAMQRGSGPLVFYVFDVLEVDGEPLVDLPLHDRQLRLRALIDQRNRTVRLSESFEDGDGATRGRDRAGSRGRDRQALELASTRRAGERATG